MSGSTSIARLQTKADFDAFVEAMWLMFLRAPGRPDPDVDGMFDLGEIGEVRETKIRRVTPYSPAVCGDAE